MYMSYSHDVLYINVNTRMLIRSATRAIHAHKTTREMLECNSLYLRSTIEFICKYML